MRYCANCWVETEEDIAFEDLKANLEASTTVDVDFEGGSAGGIGSIEIDWDSLRPG